MAKNSRKKGHSSRNGNATSPYQKYSKLPFAYSSDYKHNYLDEMGRLCRHGKPVERFGYKRMIKEAAE